MSGTDLKEKEEAAIDPNSFEKELGSSFSDDEKSRLNDLSDQVGGGYKNDNKSSSKFKLTRKKALFGGATGLVIGSFGVLSIVQGPLQSIHLSKVLSNSLFSRNDSTSNSSTRRLYNTVSGQREKNNLGALASVLAGRQRVKLADMGIQADFETANGKRRAKLQSFTIDPSTPEGKSMLGRAMVEGLDIDPAKPGQKITIDVRGREGGKIARALTDQAVDLSGKKGVTGWLAKRRLKKLYGVNFHPLNVSKRKAEDITDYLKRRRAERAGDIENGSSKRRANTVGDEKDADGNDIPKDPDSVQGSSDAGNVVDDISNESNPETKRKKVAALRKSPVIKWGAAGAAVVSIVCAVRDVGSSVEKYQMSNIIKPLIRMNNYTVSSGSQFQAMQDIDIYEGRFANELMYDEENGTSVMSARPIKAALGQEGGTDIDPATKAQITNAYANGKPTFFDAVDALPIGPACSADKFFGNLPIVKQLGAASSAVVSKMSSAITGKGIEEWMADLVKVLAGGAVDTLASGADFGNLLAYGGVLSANASAIPAGGIELNQQQVTQWQGFIQEERIATNKQRGLSERLFDVSSPESVVGGLFLKTSPYTQNPQMTMMALIKLPLTNLSSTFNNIGRFMKPSVSAYTIQNYDYGLPEFGIPLDQLRDSRYEDVYENLDRMEDNDFAKLKEANSKWGKCFGNPVDNQGNLTDKEVDNYKDLKSGECKNAYKNLAFRDYQIYVQDAQTIHSMACYEGVSDNSCTQLGFGS